MTPLTKEALKSTGKLAIIGMAMVGCFLTPGAWKGYKEKWRAELDRTPENPHKDNWKDEGMRL